MSQMLNGKALKYVASSTEADMAAVKSALAGESEKSIHQDGITVNIEPNIIDVIGSDTDVPAEKIDLGSNIEVNAVLKSATLDDIKAQLNNDSTVADYIVSASRVQELDKYHVSFKVRRSDGTVQTWTVSYMFLTGTWEPEFSGGDAHYLGLSFVASANSELDISEA